MSADWIFDQKHYQALNDSRKRILRSIIAEQRVPLNLQSAIDVGCGLGHFSGLLSSLGLQVIGVDAREENVLEARRRYPGIDFHVLDAEQTTSERFGRFDLVVCLGLLYHLENPFRVVRNLAGMASQLALVEGMVYPSPEPIMSLLDENNLRDQGLNYVAFYPTETCLAKMLIRSGFSNCYLPNPMPDHSAFQHQPNGFRLRSMLAASKIPLSSAVLEPFAGPQWDRTPWTMPPLYTPVGLFGRLQNLIGRFVQRRVNTQRSGAGGPR